MMQKPLFFALFSILFVAACGGAPDTSLEVPITQPDIRLATPTSSQPDECRRSIPMPLSSEGTLETLMSPEIGLMPGETLDLASYYDAYGGPVGLEQGDEIRAKIFPLEGNGQVRMRPYDLADRANVLEVECFAPKGATAPAVGGLTETFKARASVTQVGVELSNLSDEPVSIMLTMAFYRSCSD